jgi:hypothetical protein
MNRFLKSAVLSAGLGAASLAALPAQAGGWNHGGWGNGGYYRGGYYHGGYYGGGGNAVAAGVIGLATGALIGSIASQPRYAPYYGDPVYVERPVRYYAPPRPVYVGPSLEPWSRQWYQYCSSRYRSFDPRSGTFVGYDGRAHFCQG